MAAQEEEANSTSSSSSPSSSTAGVDPPPPTITQAAIPTLDWEQDLLKGHKGSVLTLAKLNNAHLLASGSEDATVRIWDTRIGK